MGLVIALAEIGIGVGALSGLAFRVAALGGAALSGLFFLTASWGTHPYYLGADLPYAFGWLALAIAGHGGLLVPAGLLERIPALLPGPQFVDRRAMTDGPTTSDRRRRRRLAAKEAARQAHRGTIVGYGPRSRGVQSSLGAGPPSPERRLLLQTAVLAALAAAVGSFSLPLRALGITTEHGPTGGTGAPGGAPGSSSVGLTPGPSPAPGTSAAPGSGPSAAATAPPGREVVAHVSDVTQGGGAAYFQIPSDAPAPLLPGDPAVIVQLADGSLAAFDAVCTHAGCTVEYDQPDGVLFCPCHGAAYDPAHGAAVLGGPAPQPLMKLPIVVDQASGSIYLAG
jgi:thiosulfate dehydrogenase [quinone] large subunit